MKPYCLYELVFPNGKKYLGISHQPEVRWNQQCRAAARRKQDFPLYKAIRKYGSNSVRRRILVNGPLDYIREMEIAAIAAFNTQVPRGYNVALGGQISPALVPTIAKKMSDGQLRVWADPTYRQMMREKARQRVRSPEHCANLSRAKKKEWERQESRQKYINSHIGKRPSEETRKKMSTVQKGHPNRNHRKMLLNEKGQFVRAMTDDEVPALTHTTETK
jgi:hypothetical protein